MVVSAGNDELIITPVLSIKDKDGKPARKKTHSLIEEVGLLFAK